MNPLSAPSSPLKCPAFDSANSLGRTLLIKFPQLQKIPGEKLLNDLDSWFETGIVDQATFRLPNILLTPLVVLTQITQFSRYLSLSLSNSESQAGDLHTAFAQRNSETVGFCTGLLSASVVSSSSNQSEFRRYGAVAVRLSMLIGALVDAQDASDQLHGRSKSFAAAWSSPAMAEELVRILDCFPEVSFRDCIKCPCKKGIDDSS